MSGLPSGRCKRLTGMAAIGPGIGNDANLYRSQRSVAFGAELDTGSHRMTRGRADELFLAGKLPHDRTPGFQRSEETQILGDHLLLSAEPAADALGEDVEVTRRQSEDVAELAFGNEWCLRAGAYMKASVIAFPCNTAVCFEMDMLYAGS